MRGSQATDLRSPTWVFFNGSIAHNTPAIDSAGNIFLVPTSGAVLCLRPNGEVKWRYLLRTGNSPSPALYNGNVYVSDILGNAYALDANSGAEVWVANVSEGTHADAWALVAGHGLVVMAQTAFRRGEGREDVPEHMELPATVVAVDAASGAVRWRTVVPAPFCNVMPAFADNGRALLVADSSSGVHKLDAASGALLWSVAGHQYSFRGEVKSKSLLDWRSIFIPSGADVLDMFLPRTLCAIAAVWRAAPSDEELLFNTGSEDLRSGFVRALRVRDGSELWRATFDQHMGNGVAVGTIFGICERCCALEPSSARPPCAIRF